VRIVEFTFRSIPRQSRNRTQPIQRKHRSSPVDHRSPVVGVSVRVVGFGRRCRSSVSFAVSGVGRRCRSSVSVVGFGRRFRSSVSVSVAGVIRRFRRCRSSVSFSVSVPPSRRHRTQPRIGLTPCVLAMRRHRPHHPRLPDAGRDSCGANDHIPARPSTRNPIPCCGCSSRWCARAAGRVQSSCQSSAVGRRSPVSVVGAVRRCRSPFRPSVSVAGFGRQCR
jgi:hypothetical protein